jgi:hypothetical protein
MNEKMFLKYIKDAFEFDNDLTLKQRMIIKRWFEWINEWNPKTLRKEIEHLRETAQWSESTIVLMENRIATLKEELKVKTKECAEKHRVIDLMRSEISVAIGLLREVAKVETKEVF